MRTWSAEELFVKAYSVLAVAVASVMDFGRQLERTTRPLGHDMDGPVDDHTKGCKSA